MITSDQSIITSSTMASGTAQWMSPELLVPGMFGLKKNRPTKESDCYGLGMTIYEVFSGRVPFAPCNDAVVIINVLHGERPGRPQGRDEILFTDGVWRILEFCWKQQPCDRISAETVLLGLEGSPFPSGPPYNADGDVGTDVDGESDITSNDSGMFSSVHPVSPPIHLCALIGSQIADGDNRPPAPPRAGGPKVGWAGRLAQNARKMFSGL
jgi:serine/threonine protein kinase